MVGNRFERPDGRKISYEPTEEFFEMLPHFEEEELRGFGLQLWSEETGLWLFPVEWYEHIPEGLTVYTINEREEEFDPDDHTKDRRFGALSYGIVKDGETEPFTESDEEPIKVKRNRQL